MFPGRLGGTPLSHLKAFLPRATSPSGLELVPAVKQLSAPAQDLQMLPTFRGAVASRCLLRHAEAWWCAVILLGGAYLGAEHLAFPCSISKVRLISAEMIWESSSGAPQTWLAVTMSTKMCPCKNLLPWLLPQKKLRLETIPGEIIRLKGNTHAPAVGLWIFQICHAERTGM